MERRVWWCAAVLVAVAGPAVGQGIRSVSGDGPIQISAQVRHTTTVVLPGIEVIADVVAGDAEYWDVSAAANVAYVKPLAEGVESNVTLVGESGGVWALVVSETADQAPDLVVYVAAAGADARTSERLAPAFVPGAALAFEVAEGAAARSELGAVAASAAASVAAVWREHAAERDAWVASYPGRLRFSYELPAAARQAPFSVDALWHDGRFTYLRSRAQETPAMYELRGEAREPALVTYRLFEDGLYVADHVVGAGRLRIGNDETDWSVRGERRNSGWSWKAAGGMAAAVAAAFVLAGGW